MASNGTQGLKDASGELLKTLGDRAMSAVSSHMDGLTDKLEDVAGGGPVSGLVGGALKSKVEGGSTTGGALKGAFSGIKDKITGGGGGGKGKSKPETKATTILEDIDVGVPVSVAYNQWTEFASFPQMMRKVEKVEAQDDTKLNWKAQIVWSHRTWEATIIDQVPDERIVWRSKGQKGHVDGAVTFHEIAPNLTRISLTLEYFPQGLFERTGNIWRAQGRRARSELKRFRQHVMTQTILNEDELEGWRGEIHDGEVVQSHEDALEEEQSQQGEDQEQPEDETEDYEDEGEDEGEPEEEGEPEDEAEDYEDEGEPEEEGEPEDEAEDYEDEGEPEEEAEPEDEYDEEAADEGEPEEEGEPEDEAEDYEDEGEPEEEAEPEDEYDEEAADEGEPEEEAEPEDEAEDYEGEPEDSEQESEEESEEESEDKQPARRRRARR
ncbi:SRPBCC family protein [Nocardioides sp. CER19]|uniref:SRPBCC family protein n=1 Tax=Nocardioides sp. CER19 TaxID=3038538 RepID=UPI002448D7EE|nr:SRPBCC family protein [Nocardioides sp. CER19]MDH2415872.1 SRPBCC family protein [Nocardioides sp. CER19]